MKNGVLILTFLLLTVISYSQITITGAHLPKSGFTYFTSTDTTPTVSLGSPSSSAQSWNFSSLLMDYPSVPTYGSTSWTPYATAFPTSNIYTYGPASLYSSLFGGAPVSSQGMNNGYMFWKSDNTGFWAVGFRADSGTYAGQNINYNPDELLIGAPCTYGNSFNNVARWELPMNVNTLDVDTYYVCRTVKTITCDAWGSLTTPFGTFPGVIRQHEYVIKYDSVYAKMGTTVITSMELLRTTSNNYLFLSNTISYPACIVHADVNNVIKDIEWYTGLISGNADVSGQKNEFHAFPNPVSDEVTLEFVLQGNEDIEIYLIDLSGKKHNIVPRHNLISGKHALPISLKNLPSGVYLMALEKNKALSFQKITIIH